MVFQERPRHVTRRKALGLAVATVAASSCRAQSSDPAPSGPQIGLTASDPLVRTFYAQRGGAVAWDEDQASFVGRAIADARRHGLDPGVFIAKLSPGASPDTQDEAVTVAALAYAKALATGFVEPERIEDIFTLERNAGIDLAAGLGQALQQQSVAEWLGSLAPSDAEYQALSGAYLTALKGRARPFLTPQARQLAANLERRRWLTRSPTPHRIDVNTAGCFLGYFTPGQQTWGARTVCGRDDHTTPSIEASFQRLIANPPWRVPTEIARKEIFPKGRGYMRRERMHVVDGRVLQRPGPRCALGVVKFDVDDPYDIYLHDTPSKSLFRRADRHRSHGCVRVQNALDLARLIAAQSNVADNFEQGLKTGKTAYVELGQTIAVRTLYHTAFFGPDGRVALAPDAYGWDDDLATALGLGQAAATRPTEGGFELGP
jgi:murein L,D-transpeptidase YcbB/YkuD